MKLIYTLILLFAIIPNGVNADSGHLYTQNSTERDCSVHKLQSDNTSLGFKLGTFLVGIGPEISWGNQSGINWHPNQQNVIMRYQQLCADYNSGIINKDEYKSRLLAIEAMQVDYQSEQYLHEQKLFDELDELTKDDMR